MREKLYSLLSKLGGASAPCPANEAELARLNRELLQEVAERRETETELQKAKAAAEAANQAKSRFLANVSHEIRTPMNGILGMTTLALGEEVSPRLRNRLRIIRESANSLLSLVNDLLDFSKMEAGQFQIHPEPFDLQQELIGTVQMLDDRAKQKGLQLSCEIAPDVPGDVCGDAGRLRQVLVNLIGNAIKFTQKGSVLVEVRVRERTDPTLSLEFEVRDTGIGIAADKLQSIFSPFVQGDSSTTRQYGGTGLGLSIARNLIELMGGRIDVESSVGHGSVFRFTIILERATETAITLPGNVLGRLKNLTALVIDENMTRRLATEEMLKKWGLRPTGAADVTKAVEFLQAARQSKQRFDLILLDERVGGEDATAIARRLRKDHRCTHPIILLGDAACENGKSGLTDAAIANCLSKPFTPSDLIEAIAITLQFSTFEINLKSSESSHSIELPDLRPLAILLAEDNAFNQCVASEMLEKVGHKVTMVSTGREALEAVENQAFDLVVMDVQMPEMDGLAATAAIRAREQTTGRHVPIIAMTAHAMKSDQEICLRGGMDGFLSKPVNLQQMHLEIARVLTATGNIGAARFGAAPDSGAKKQTLEVQPVQERRDRRRQRMLDLFRAEGPHMLAEIRAAVTAADAPRLAKAAHKLAGAVSYLAAPEAEQAARNLEGMARTGNIALATTTLAQLEKSLFRFDPALIAACGYAMS